MRKRIIVTSLFLFAVLIISDKSLGQGVSTINAFIGADVSTDGYGLISFYIPTSPKTRLSFDQKSYLTVQVNGKFYTNNTLLPLTGQNPPYPTAPSGYLRNGRTQKIRDTIRTTWSDINSVDIIQDVYPVLFPITGSGQIVYRLSAVNHTDSSVSVQGQYMLDLESNTTDNPNIATSAGYIKTNLQPSGKGWAQFPNNSFNRVPSFYATFEKGLCTPQFPGVIGVGYTNDSVAPEPMDLIAPSMMAVIDWPTIVQSFTWGVPSPSQTASLNMGDDALLMQWPSFNIDTGKTLKIGAGSYGTGVCMATGNVAAMVFHPERIRWTQDRKYKPNPFKIETLILNPSSSNTISSAIAMQQVSGPLHVIAPQLHDSASMSSSTIQTCDLVETSWIDSVDNSLINCATDSVYSINISIGGSGVSSPFFTAPTSGNTLSCPIAIDCQKVDLKPPLFTRHIAGGVAKACDGTYPIYTWIVSDSSSLDAGLHSITNTPDSNLQITIVPSIFTDCPKTAEITVIQKDTTKSAKTYFVYTDCYGNSTIDTVSFSACLKQAPKDTLPPLIQFFHLTNVDTCTCFKIWAFENRPIDKGLDTLEVSTLNNVTINSIKAYDTTYIYGAKSAIIDGRAIDPQASYSLCVSAIDIAGNRTDTCFSFAASGVTPNQNEHVVLSVFPNPTDGMTTLSLDGAPSANVQIFDVLGREIEHFKLNGSYQWHTDELPAATYIVRATIGDNVISKRVVKK